MKLIYSGVVLVVAVCLFVACNRNTKKEEVVSDVVVEANDSLKLVAGSYVNDDLGYRITYPKDILFLQEDTLNTDKQVFLPKEGKAKFTIYKDERRDKSGKVLSFNEAFDIDKESSGNRQIAYNSLNPLFYAISGVEGNEIFYQKTIVSNNVMVTAKLTYTKEEKTTYDAMIAPLFNSFK